jgi:ketosteroid isomerase-like protein
VDFRGFYADGDVVVVEETMTATAAGVPYVNDYCFVFELVGDRIHRVREHMDTARGHRQLAGVSTVR